MPGVAVRAPAKINLHLGVGPVRADGFHPLATAYQAISLFSTVTATPAEDWSVTCEGGLGIEDFVRIADALELEGGDA